MMVDQSHFESLYTEYHPMVYQMCLGFVKGRRDEADDLVQEVFINVWKALDRFRGESSYKTWIYRITVNSCLQFIRKEKGKTMLQIPFGDHPSDGAMATTVDVHRDLYHAIGQLEEIDRLVIMMVLDEMEYEEIARVVGVREATLRVRIHRIKTRLKNIMEYETRD